jgi:hypothetical protein
LLPSLSEEQGEEREENGVPVQIMPFFFRRASKPVEFIAKMRRKF